jgi:hypothetical protein
MYTAYETDSASPGGTLTNGAGLFRVGIEVPSTAPTGFYSLSVSDLKLFNSDLDPLDVSPSSDSYSTPAATIEISNLLYPVPEPSTLVLIGAGSACGGAFIVGYRRRKRRKSLGIEADGGPEGYFSNEGRNEPGPIDPSADAELAAGTTGRIRVTEPLEYEDYFSDATRELSTRVEEWEETDLPERCVNHQEESEPDDEDFFSDTNREDLSK